MSTPTILARSGATFRPTVAVPPLAAPALAAMALLALACAPEDEQPARVFAEVPTFEGSIDLEIGEMDGDDPYLFTRIASIVGDAQGRLLVADGQTSEIRVFEADGTFALRAGGHGEGPGELSDICCLAIGPYGELWVRESARYSVFALQSASAEYLRGMRSLHPGTRGLREPFTFDADGNLVNVGPVTSEDGTNLTAQLRGVTARLLVSPDGAVDTVVLANADRQYTGQATSEFVREAEGRSIRGIMYLHHWFGPAWIHAHADGGAWAEAVTSHYSINYHHPDGTVSLIEGPPLEGPVLSPDERTTAESRIQRDLDRSDLDNHPFGIPDRKPPLEGMFFDAGGRLWVEKSAADGDETREADVWAGTELVARYRWPRRINELPTPWATDSMLYGVTTDSLGVQRVARVRFETGN
ncbi:MAG: hypothetical protein OXH51_01190 [Gemmatimonadetes bacterium]|nr:hypothetical protein [Gemmatimonadota bacterium]